MKRVMKWFGVAIAALLFSVALLFVGTRFADGPLGMIPGGPFRTGAWASEPDPDFHFATDIELVEIESAGRSRTVWLVVQDGKAYAPVSLDFPPGKRWHHEALENPAAVLRVNGQRYRRRLVRVEDEERKRQLGELVRAKYSLPAAASDTSRVWFFHLAPAPTG